MELKTSYDPNKSDESKSNWYEDNHRNVNINRSNMHSVSTQEEDNSQSIWTTFKTWLSTTFTFSSDQKIRLSLIQDLVIKDLKEYDSSWKISLRGLRVIPFIGVWLDDNFGHHHNERMKKLIESITGLNESDKNSPETILRILQTEINAVTMSQSLEVTVAETIEQCTVRGPNGTTTHAAKLPVVNYLGDEQAQQRSGFFETVMQAKNTATNYWAITPSTKGVDHDEHHEKDGIQMSNLLGN